MIKMQPTDGQLTIIDGDGNEKLCQILFTLDSEEFEKKYVVFYPIEKVEDDDEQIELMAAIYVEGPDGTGELSQVETDEEWEMLEEAVRQYEDQMDSDCCCGHDHCDHDDCDDCEDEDDDDDDCCCHHHEHHHHHHD